MAVSSPAQKGESTTLRWLSVTASGSISPRSSNAAISGLWLCAVTPRSCTLARAVNSIIPLPCDKAASATPKTCAAVICAMRGLMRTTNPSPDSIGRKAPGHQPLMSNSAMCHLQFGSDGIAPRYPKPRIAQPQECVLHRGQSIGVFAG